MLFVAASFSAEGQIAAWDFSTLPGGTNNYGPSPYSATTSDANVTVVGLTRGAGVTTTGTAASSGWGGNGFFDGSSLATAITAANYATFTITANPGSALSLSSISAYNIRLSGSGPATGQWQYRVGNGSFISIGAAITWGANTTASGNVQSSIDLTGISALQNISANSTATFRVVCWNASNNAGTWYFNDPDGLPAADLTINGSVFICGAPPSADPPTTATACVGVGTEIAGNPTGGSGGYSHLWTNVGTGTAFGVSLLDQTMETVTASAMSAGTIDLKYLVTDNNGCTGSKAVTVTVNPSPTGTLTETDMSGSANNDNIICAGGSATFTATSGLLNYDFRINGNSQQDGISNVFNTPPPTLNDGDDVDVVVTDGLGCKAIFITPTMAVNELPVPMISAQTNVACYGNTTGSVTVSGGTMYSLNGGAFQMSGTFSGLSAVPYTVTVKNANGCTADQLVTITQPAAPLSASIGSQTNVQCYGQATGSVTVVGVDGTSPYMYSFDGSPYGPSGTFSSYAAGAYTVTVKDANNCTFDQAVTITQPDQLSATVTPTHLTCFEVNEGQINITGATGGTGPYEYSIDGMSWHMSGAFTNLAAGSYNVRIRDAVNCTVTLNSALVITQPAELDAMATSMDVTCNGVDDGEINITDASGGSGMYEFSIDGGMNWQSDVSYINLPPTTYDVKIRDANYPLCVVDVDPNVEISEPDVLDADVVVTNITCFADDDGIITVSNPTGGYGDFEYQLDSEAWQPTSVYTNLEPGTYSIHIRDADHPDCEISLGAFEIMEPDPLTAFISDFENASCAGASNGFATVSVNGGTALYTYDWAGAPSGDGTPTIIGLAAGNYPVTIVDANGCVATASAVIMNPSALSVLTLSTGVSCNGLSDGSATVNPSGGTIPYSYDWAGSPNGDGTNMIIDLAAGTYNVTITDANFCVTSTSVIVSQPDVLLAGLTPDHVNCNGGSDGSATVLVTGGTTLYSYDWTGMPTGEGTSMITDLSEGTYSVTVTDANGCVTSTSVVIMEPDVLESSISASDNVSCNGGSDGSATVLVTGGTTSYSYDWTGIPTGEGTNAITDLSEGTYGVTITDANGCVTSTSVVITEPDVLESSISASVNVSCNGGSDGSATVLVTGGTTSYSYDWTGTPTGEGTNAITGLSEGTYGVTVTDANGCVTSTSVAITDPDVLEVSISASDNVSCNGGSDGSATVLVTGGTTSYSYDWTGMPTGEGTNAITDLSAGTYGVTVTDANGCVTSTSVVIMEPDVLESSISASVNVSCNGGSDGSATVLVTGGTTSYSYDWTGIPTGEGTNAITGLSEGTYGVTITDANGCVASTSVMITEPDVLEVSISASDNVSCNGGSDGSATVLVTGGTTLYSYDWTGMPTGEGTNAVTGLSEGTYGVTVTDANGCVTSTSVVISEPDILFADLAYSNVGCYNAANAGIYITNPVGGYGTYEYTINGGMSWHNDGTFTGLAPGTYNIKMRDAGHPACMITLDGNLIVSQPDELSADVTPTEPTCFGASDGSITIDNEVGGMGTFEYSIDGGTNWLPSGAFTGLVSGTYNILIRDGIIPSCFVTLDNAFVLGQPAVLSATVTPVDATCFGVSDGSITISNPAGGHGTYQYSIDAGATWQGSGSFLNLPEGVYDVLIRDAANNTCSIILNAALAINQPNILNATVMSTNLTCYHSNNGTITISAPTGGHGTYEYSIDGGSSWQSSGSYTNLLPGSYDVQIRDAAYQTCVIVLNPALVIIEPAQVFVAAITGSNIVYVATSTQLSNATPLMGGSALWESSLPSKASVDQTGFVFGLMMGTTIISYTVTDVNNCTNSATFTMNVSVPVINIGVYNHVAASPAGNKLKIKINPTVEVINGQYSAGTFTLRTATSNGVTGITVLSGLGYPNPYNYHLVGSNLNDGGYDYYVFNFNDPNLINWSANSFIDALTIGYNCAWNATFEIVQNYISPPLFGNYYQELNGAGAQNQISPASVTSPLAINLVTAKQDQWCSSLGWIELTVTNGSPSTVSPEYTYDWSNDGPDTPDDDTQNLSNLSAGTYTVTVTDANGCMATTSAAILYLPVTNTTLNTHYATIQAAIDAANPGNNIDICAGTYYEVLNVNKANLTLNGAGIGMTIVDHTGKSPASNAGVHVIANGVAVNNLTVTGNPANSVPRYGFKVGTSTGTTDNVVLDHIQVQNSYRTGFDIARAKNLTMTDIEATNNGGAGVFMTNTEGALLTNITTSGNPWTGVSVATRDDWGGVSTGVVFSGANSFGESAGKNGGLQLEMTPAKLISWSNDIGDGKNVTILPADFGFALSGPTVNMPYAPYVRFYKTLSQAQTAAAGVGANKPDHIEAINRYIRDADNSAGEPGTNFYVYDNPDNTMTIQAAVNAAVAGNTINVYEGTFTENVLVNKSVTITGAGSGSNPATNTVLNPSSACTGEGITIAAANVTVQNMYLTGYLTAILINGVNSPTLTNLGLVDYCLYGINLGGNSQNINITQTRIQRMSFLAGTIGIRAGTANAVNGMMIDGCSITGNTQGITVFQATTPVAFDNITIQNDTISNNTLKGMYFEKLSNALFSNLIMDNNGTDASYTNNNGIDINLKYNSYSNITIQNCEITNSGATGTATDPQAPAAVTIKARDDASSYNSNPATLSNVLIKNNKITGPRNGIRIGEYGKVNGSPSNVTIQGNDLSYAFGNKALITRTNQDVEVQCNWHGTNDLPTIQASFATAGSGQINLNTVLDFGTGSGPGFVPTGNCVCPSGNLVTNSTTLATYCSIQDAIDAAANGQELVVGPGTYVEDVVVNKQLSILGPNAAINPCSGSRVDEAIVMPATAAIASGEIFHVAASNVTISGFKITGDNPAITSGFSSTNGADIDAAEGITVYETGVNNLTVTNNIIENLSYFAVTLYDYPAGVPSTGHLIANNKIQNLGTYDAGSGVASWGGGVLLYNNQYADVTNNCMNNVRLGVQTGNFYLADPGSSALISGNTMTNVRRTGVFHNLHYGSASPYTVSNNTISGVSNANETKWNGVSLFSLAVPATAQGNIINASSVAQASSGIEVWNVKSSSPAVIIGGSVTDVTTGVFVNNFDGYASDADDGAHATISGITINPVALGTGIRVYDNPSSTHANVQASVGAGVAINNGTNGLVVENTSASVPSLGNVAFTGQTSNYIKLINNANNINATTATFEGNTGAVAPLAQNFAIEDKVLHKIDNGVLGFVLVKANHDFVTINSFSAPATTVALVQRGVDAASPGFTVNVNSGTYANAVNINKELKLYGLYSGISPVTGVRLMEATLATSTGTMVQVTTTDPVEIKGLRLANTGGPFDYSVSAAVGTSVVMEKNFFDNSIGVYIPNAVTTTIADNLCTFSSGADEGFALFGNYNGSTGTHIDVHDNKWLNGQMTGMNLSSCEGVIYNNIFDNIAYYGILAANQSNLDIYQNEFTDIDNPDPMVTTWGAGVRFYDDAPGAIVNVHNNTFTGNYIGISVRPDYDFSGNTANVYDNSITGSTIANIRHEGAGTLPSECNWFGFTASAAVAATISGTVDYNPWRVSSTDTDLGTLGFQPTGPCSGLPVEIAVNVVSPETCTGGTANGSITTITSNGLAPYTYLWSNATTNADATGLIGGTYTVVVTDANGSTAVTNATVLALLVSNFTTSTNYATVQAAINAAMPNDVIQMCTKTFNERVVIDKSLTLEGKTSMKENYVLNGTGLGIGDGIHLNNNVTGVTIRNLTVQNFTGTNGNSNAAIYALGGNNMLTVTNVALLNNPTASGFYANGPISTVSITNSMVVNNGGNARGIVIWNGFKQNITITGNMLTNNTCCGIELQDGTASNVMVSGNTINIGAGDNAIGLLGLNNSIGNNLIQNNIITGGGRFGIEIKNPNGGVTVSGNMVTLTTQDASPRDRAGIAVFRRDFTAGNPQGYTDIPNGVTISGNTVSGYTQPSSEEGFGIVVEGVSHSITGNTITGSDVGIQIQGGGHANANYVPNDVGSGDQDAGNSPNYFGRGNAPYVCDISESGNVLSGNGIDRRMVTSAGVFTDPAGMATINNQLAREVTLDNGVTQRVYCTIQAAVDASLGDGSESVKVASKATQTRYNEQVLVNKDVTVIGVGPTKPILDFTSTPALVSSRLTLFEVTRPGVTIDNFDLRPDLSKLGSAVIASNAAFGVSNLAVKNNMISPYRSSVAYTAFDVRNAVNINYGAYRVNSSNPVNLLVEGNTISYNVGADLNPGTSDDAGFRAGIAVDEGTGTFTTNTITTVSQDIEARFTGTANDINITNNNINGGGVNFAAPNNSGGSLNITGNTFNGAASNTYSSSLRLKDNIDASAKSTIVQNNIFNNHNWGISLENYKSVTVDNNTFTPVAGSTTFRHITINTKELNSSSATVAQTTLDGVFTNNEFYGSGTPGGKGMVFLNHDSDDDSYGTFTMGSTGNENEFNAGINSFIEFDGSMGASEPSVTFPENNVGSVTTMACWDRDIDIEKNKFDVGAGLQLPKNMSGLQLGSLEDKLWHQRDNACLGELIYFKPVMVNAKVYLQGPYDATTMLPHLMGDRLRQIVAMPKFPLLDPYPAFTPDIAPYWDAFVHVNHTTTEVIDMSVLDDFNANSIVDWVFLELRNPLNYLEVLATRSALVQRDGDIVDLDGTSEVLFPNSYKGNYYLMVRHRNHLGAMTANVIDFTNDAAFIDFSSPSMPTFGTTSLSARKLLEPGVYGLIAGNTNMKVNTSAPFQVIYNNDGNDRSPILTKIGFLTPLNVVPGYFLEDVNLDGEVKYNGDKNDRVIILNNVGLATPLNIITQQPPN